MTPAEMDRCREAAAQIFRLLDGLAYRPMDEAGFPVRAAAVLREVARLAMAEAQALDPKQEE